MRQLNVLRKKIVLKDCIVKLAHLGFPLTLKDIEELVESFVNINNVETAKNILKYGGRRGHPVPDWTNLFIKRNNLSLKQATKLSVPRYNAIKNPFAVYHYCDILEEAIERLNFKDKPHLIWNCNESGLPHEPKNCQVVTEKGQNTILVRAFNIYIFLCFFESII